MAIERSGRYDVQRVFYDRMYSRHTASDHSVMGRLIKRCELDRSDAVARLLVGGGTLLDIGSGDGRLALTCGPRFAHVIGVDLVFDRLRLAANRASGRNVHNARFVAANIDRGLPLGDAVVDTVAAVAVIGFIFDPLSVFDEIHRVLRPNGAFVLEVLNLAYLPRRLALLLGRFPRHSTAHGWDGGHLHNFTRGELAEALVAHGFRPDAWSGSGVLAPIRTWWPSLLTGNLIVSSRRV